MSKTKIHTRYKLEDGTPIPGVTTVTGELGWAKNQLMHWAWNLGKQGIDYKKFSDDKAAIGTIAHGLLLQQLGGEKFNLDDYSKNQIDQAENSLISYFEWAKGKKIEPILLEKQLISKEHRFGGTIDCYCLLDGIKTLIDYKTGSGVYNEMLVQVGGGYKYLLEANLYEVQRVIILNIPRTQDESFIQKEITNTNVCWEIFYHALMIYRKKKILGDKHENN